MMGQDQIARTPRQQTFTMPLNPGSDKSKFHINPSVQNAPSVATTAQHGLNVPASVSASATVTPLRSFVRFSVTQLFLLVFFLSVVFNVFFFFGESFIP
jgi:hypothetical protein